MKNSVLFLLIPIISLAGCVSQTQPSGPTAVSTEDDGFATFNIAGLDTTFQFIDEQDVPTSGLAVGFAYDEKQGQGVLLAIDPNGQLPPQIFVLHGTEQKIVPMSIFPIGVRAAESSDNGITVLVKERLNSLVQDIALDHLPPWVRNTAEKVDSILEIAPLAAKAIDSAGIPLGKYAGTLGRAQKTAYTQDEYFSKMKDDIKQNVKNKIFFMVTGDTPDARSVAIDTATYTIDASAAMACGPTKGANRIEVVAVYNLEFVGCKSLTMEEQVAGLARATTEAVDPYGQPLSTGSLELVSKANVGFGTSVPLNTQGKTAVEVPKGNYIATVSSPGYSPYTKDVQIQEGADVKFNLGPVQISGKFAMLVGKNGDGSGTVTSSRSGINCGSDCSEIYEGGSITLFATPNDDSAFEGWSGVCSGTGDCTIALDKDNAVTATFSKSEKKKTTVTISIIGGGSVRSSDGVINCPGACSGVLKDEFPFLIAKPPEGGFFLRWESVNCFTEQCPLTPNELQDDLTITALFEEAPLPPTEVTYSGSFDGNGLISRTFPGYTTCTFSDTFSGTIDLTLAEEADGTVSGTAEVSGSFVSTAVSGSTGEFTCLDGQESMNDDVAVSGTKSNIQWSTSFSTAGGSTFVGAFSGALSGDSVTGTLVESSGCCTGSVSMPVTLDKK